MKNTLTKLMMLSVLVLPVSMALSANANATTPWNVTGEYTVEFNHLGNDHAHEVSLTQGASNTLTGMGESGAYAWVITSGSVNGSDVEFTANYTATADAVTPQTIMHVNGTIAQDGSLSGTWSDNYQGGTRTGTWATVDGTASLKGDLAAEDFNVVHYDTGHGYLVGYSAGFGLSDATFADAQSIVVKLYAANNVLLQTNTLNGPNAHLVGSQITAPFDVSGNFDYQADG